MLAIIFEQLNFDNPFNFLIRLILAFALPFLIMIFSGNRFISLMKSKQGKGQPIREDGPKSHLAYKKGTPTMGGLLMIISVIISAFLCLDFRNPFVLICLLVLLSYGIIGFIDDYQKVTKQTSNAMTPRMKLFLQFSLALVAILTASYFIPENSRFNVNFISPRFALNLSWFYVPFAMVVIVGSSNAVNLTDGLDGLVSGLLAIVFFAFAILYIFLTPNYAELEIAILCILIFSTCIGFLWFNAFPAKIFMGDTGSLAFGALLGTTSVIMKSEILLAIIGAIFVIEALSVMLQVFWFKRTGKRIFKMAPIHHHFEQLGMHESTVVMRFWIIGFLLATVGIILVMGVY